MLQNIIQSLFARGAVALINLVVLILSSKYLGVNTRGEISIFVLNITIVQVVCSVYTGYSIVHFIPRFNFKRILTDGIVFTILFAALSSLIIILLNKQVAGYEWFGYVISLLVILNTFNCMILLGKENIKAFNQLSVMQPLLLLAGIAFYTLVLKNFTVEAYLFPLTISFVVAFLSSSIFVLKYLKSDTEKQYEPKQILINGFYLQAGVIMFLFSSRISYYLLPNKADVGLYSSAVVLTESVLIIANGISPVLISKVANRENKIENAQTGLSFTKLSFLLSACGIVVLILLPEKLFTMLLGMGFSGIKDLMLNYAPAVLALSLYIPLANFFTAIGKQKITLICYLVGLVITASSAPTLIQFYGTKGAAYTVSLSATVMTIMLLFFFYLNNQLKPKQFLINRADVALLKKLWHSYISGKVKTEQ